MRKEIPGKGLIFHLISGTLFRFDSDLSRHFIKDGLSIPNGISWSKDDRTMYFVNSTEKTILAFDFDAATGNVTNERVFWTLEGDGDPDGHVQDTEVSDETDFFAPSLIHSINQSIKVMSRNQ